MKVVARESRLSLVQVREIMGQLPSLSYELTALKSFGDKKLDLSLIDNKMADIFTRELDQMILAGEADIAIHSAKDLPYPLPRGLKIIALADPKDPTDSLVSRDGKGLKDLPKGSRIGTSSKVRRDQLLALRPDCILVSLRGTIEERIKEVDEGRMEAIVVASCALERLGLSARIAERLPFSTHPLQGRLAIVARADRRDLAEMFAFLDVHKKFGRVVLCGFGPGDPGLMTLRGHEALKRADIIFYDELIDQDFLKGFHGKKVHVGKRKDSHSYPQDEINQLMFEAALAGRAVLRLKGGDPFLFGRGGEELDFLRERLIDVEVIPGVTSALGAAAVAGIPLTYREVSSSVAFCTGHSLDKIPTPSADTLVYYMAACNTVTVAETLLEKGWLPSTPVAFIRRATCPDQDVFFYTLADVAAGKAAHAAPLLMIVGKVAFDRNFARSGQARGKVLVTGTDPSGYAHLGEVVHTPLIELQPLAVIPEFEKTLQSVYDVVVFTSRYSVRYFFDALRAHGFDARWFAGKKLVSIGRTTTAALSEQGLCPDLQASDESSTGIIALFKEQNLGGTKVLIPRSEKALPVIPQGLQALGCQVELLIVYHNIMPQSSIKVDISKVDTVIFSSPSGVDNFMTLYGSFPKHAKAIARGEQTAIALKRHGILNIAFLS